MSNWMFFSVINEYWIEINWYILHSLDVSNSFDYFHGVFSTDWMNIDLKKQIQIAKTYDNWNKFWSSGF